MYVYMCACLKLASLLQSNSVDAIVCVGEGTIIHFPYKVEGKPAVVIAAEGGHIECLKLLMTAGVDTNATYGDKKLCALHRYS